MNNPSELVSKYFRTDNLPHIWCPGCSHGIVTRALVKAVDDLGLDKDNTVIVSGIGCSSRAPGYLDFNTVHTTHGRALAFATGIKLAYPKLKVIVITGDGDASAIGGNHLIHACRRNIDLTVIVYNNNIYGMTGGQYSPTTPEHKFGTTAPYGNIDTPFDICELAIGAGATYVARATAFHTHNLIKYIKKAIEHHGLSIIDAITACPTYYGRKNKEGSAPQMMRWMQDSFVDQKAFERLPEDKREGKRIMGEFCERERPEYTDLYEALIERVSEK